MSTLLSRRTAADVLGSSLPSLHSRSCLLPHWLFRVTSPLGPAVHSPARSLLPPSPIHQVRLCFQTPSQTNSRHLGPSLVLPEEGVGRPSSGPAAYCWSRSAGRQRAILPQSDRRQTSCSHAHWMHLSVSFERAASALIALGRSGKHSARRARYSWRETDKLEWGALASSRWVLASGMEWDGMEWG